MLQVGREDEFSINRQQMLARILVSMGGTVAEELVFGRDQVRLGFRGLVTWQGPGNDRGVGSQVPCILGC